MFESTPTALEIFVEAASAGDLERVKTLLSDQHGSPLVSDANAFVYYGLKNALQAAIMSDREAIVDYLLALPTINVDARNREGETVMHVLQQLYLQSPDWTTFRKYLTKLSSRADANAADDHGRTALYCSTLFDNIAFATDVIDICGADPNCARGGMTPLMMATQHDVPELVAALIHRSADVDAVDGQNRTALTWAILFHANNAIKVLLAEGAGFTAFGQSSVNCLKDMIAPILGSLLDAGFDADLVREAVANVSDKYHRFNVLAVLKSEGAK